MKKKSLIALLVAMILLCGTSSVEALAASPNVYYKLHVQNIGWMNAVCNGAMAGTTGRSLQGEGIQMQISGMSGGIQYQVHGRFYGWQEVKQNGQTAGTTGEGLQMEAIKVQLIGEIAKYYDVYYRTHVQNYGWMDFKKNGEVSGTVGENLRIEAIEVKLVAKANTSTTSNQSYMQKVNSFLSNANYTNNATWASSKRPMKSTYGGTGCCAYAADFVKEVFGKNSPRSGKAFYSPNEIKDGDILVGAVNSSSHWIVVISRNGNQLRTAEGNWGGKVVVSNSAYTIQNGKLCRNGKAVTSFAVGYHYQ